MVDDAGQVQQSEAGDREAQPEVLPIAAEEKAQSVRQAAPLGLRSWKTWVAVAVPIAALVELGAQIVQTRSVVGDQSWDAAREAAKALMKPDDGLIFSPRWTEPLGRMHFGDQLATLDRMAPQDYTRFPRVLEVSVRGEHRAETRDWPAAEVKEVGPIELRVLTNPRPVVIHDDLLTHVRPQALAVVVAAAGDGNESACSFADSAPRSGGLGFGPAIPSAKFTCSRGGPVGLTVTTDLDYYPHRCIYAPPPGSGASLRLRFASVKFGKVLYGHHGLYVEAERLKQGAPIEITFRVGEATIGNAVHEDGDGWTGFQFDTSSLDGTTDELTVDVSSSFSERRMYCFEADTRSPR